MLRSPPRPLAGGLVVVELNIQNERMVVVLGPAWYLQDDNLDRKIGDQVNVRGSLAQGKDGRTDYQGRNYISYLAGVGIQATDRLFVSALAKGSSPRSEGAEAQAEGRLKVNYMHSRRLSLEIYGLTGFTDASPDYGGGLSIIYQF